MTTSGTPPGTWRGFGKRQPGLFLLLTAYSGAQRLWVLLPAHALLMSHQDATSPQEPAEELLSTALLALLNLSPLGSWRGNG